MSEHGIADEELQRRFQSRIDAEQRIEPKDWMPEAFAHMVPATPLESTCVVLTGMPNESAIAMVVAATSSAAPPCP